jgi:hypothetical protein
MPNIKVDLKCRGCEDVCWFYLTQDKAPFIDSFERGFNPLDPTKGNKFLDQLSKASFSD